MENKKRIMIYGGSFNPPCLHHRLIAAELAKKFDLIIVYPCCKRQDKLSSNIVSPENLKEMIKLNFGGLEKTEIDFYDLDKNIFTPTYVLDGLFKEKFRETEIWHAIGEDLIAIGDGSYSEIRYWYKGEEVWKNLNFAVLERPGYLFGFSDTPPNSIFIPLENIFGSSSLVRNLIKTGKPVDDFVLPKVKEYIEKNNLYK